MNAPVDSFDGKRLVIFGCGYVGTAVALDAVARGARVIAVTRNAAKALLLREQSVETVVDDLASEAWHDGVGDGADWVLNCVSSGGGGLESYRHSYVDGMRSIVAWARERGPVGTFVYTSSTSVYPEGGGAVVDESASTEGGSDRGQLLKTAETMVENAAGEGWRRWFILRLAGIYGPGRHHVLDQVKAGEVGGAGDHHLNVIHRDDVVTAVRTCFTAPSIVGNDVFNLADDAPARKREVADWIASRLQLSPPKFTGLPAANRGRITPDRVIANTKIKRVLGWRPHYPDYRAGYAGLLSG